MALKILFISIMNLNLQENMWNNLPDRYKINK